MVCWKVWVWGVGSTEGDGSEVLLRTRVLCCAGVRPGMRSWRSILKVAASTKTTESVLPRANHRFHQCAPLVCGCCSLDVRW